MLRKLLRKLVQWARTERVPMLEGALATAEADLLETDMGILGDAIHCFIEAVEVPVLVLCGGCAWVVQRCIESWWSLFFWFAGSCFGGFAKVGAYNNQRNNSTWLCMLRFMNV